MESNKKFSVDSGHARGENISIEEIHQALRDIMNWLLTNIPSYSPPPGLQFSEALKELIEFSISCKDKVLKVSSSWIPPL